MSLQGKMVAGFARRSHVIFLCLAIAAAGAQRITTSADSGRWRMFSPQEVYRRMLLTLRVEHLRELCARHQLDTHGSANTLIERLSGAVKDEEVREFVKEKYRERIEARPYKQADISREVAKVTAADWNVVQGELDQHIQERYVRVEPRYDELVRAIDSRLVPEIRSYALTSFYNHYTTEAIEDLIALQPSVVPALKEIKGTDIFWLGQPCDVKTTFLPAAWTDQGRKIDDVMEHPDELARWLYEHQGAERFGYEIRLFIIVADRKNPADSWKLKRDFDLIQKKFTDFFAETKAYRPVSFRFHQRQYSTFYQMMFIVR